MKEGKVSEEVFNALVDLARALAEYAPDEVYDILAGRPLSSACPKRSSDCFLDKGECHYSLIFLGRRKGATQDEDHDGHMCTAECYPQDIYITPCGFVLEWDIMHGYKSL